MEISILPFRKTRNFPFKLNAVVCRASDVDIKSCSCDLTFGKKAAAVKGRKAHELFAMLGLVGVPPDGPVGRSTKASRT
jgi:hypothetical protein